MEKRKKQINYTKVLNIRLTDDMYNKLKEVEKNNNISISNQLRIGFELFLNSIK